MSARTLFVTGTDTGVGKTRIATLLIRQARAQGLRVCGWKPVASGCEPTAAGLRNADALALQDAAGTDEPYEQLNPFAYEPAIAPHLAAAQCGRPIRLATLERVHGELAARHDLIVAEGAGGWRVPLDEAWTIGSWVAEHEWPVLLVVGLRLGCLSHAMLTAEAIARDTQFAGWVGNVLPPPMAQIEDNVDALRRRLPGPCFGRVDAGAAILTVQRGLDAPLANLWRAAPVVPTT